MVVTVVAAVGCFILGVLISLETAPTMPSLKWWGFLLGSLVLAVLVPLGAWLERRQQNHERAEDYAKFEELFQGLRDDIADIKQKPEAPEKQIQEVTQRIDDFWHSQRMARNQAMGTKRMNLFAPAGVWVDAQKRAWKDDPK